MDRISVTAIASAALTTAAGCEATATAPATNSGVVAVGPSADMADRIERARAARVARIVAEAVHARAAEELAEAREAEACAKSDLTRAVLSQAGYGTYE